ncbi:hypothetical protein pb186bvf_012653 [Paramecium bursaria]
MESVIEYIKSIVPFPQILPRKLKVDVNHFYQRIQDASNNKLFTNLAQTITQTQKIQQPQLNQIVLLLKNLQDVMNDLHQKKKSIKIKINKFIDQWAQETFSLALELNHSAHELAQASCGGGERLKSFNNIYEKFEVNSYLWLQLHQFENADILIDENQLRQKLEELLKGNQQIVYIERNNEMKVEKQEKAVLVNQQEQIRTIEVEKIVYKDREVIKEVEKIIYIPQNNQTIPNMDNLQNEIKKINQQLEILLRAHENIHGINCIPNISQGINLYKQANDVNSNNALGQLYMEGKHVDQNLTTALQYYKYGVQRQNPESLYQAGKLLMLMKQDLQTGFEYIRKASDLNHQEAIIDLGLIYYQGIRQNQNYFIEPDHMMAINLLKKAQNNPRGSYFLGLYSDNPQEQQFYIQKSIEMGNNQGYHALGQIQENLGNIQEALKYYKQGAILHENTCIEAILPILYEQSLDNDNMEEFQSYLRELIVNNICSDAYYYMGLTNNDPKLQIKYYQIGMEMGNPKCMVKIGDIDNNEELYFKAAKLGNPEGLYKVGLIFERQGNDELAFQCFQDSKTKESYKKLAEYYKQTDQTQFKYYETLGKDRQATSGREEVDYDALMSIILGQY